MCCTGLRATPSGLLLSSMGGGFSGVSPTMPKDATSAPSVRTRVSALTEGYGWCIERLNTADLQAAKALFEALA